LFLEGDKEMDWLHTTNNKCPICAQDKDSKKCTHTLKEMIDFVLMEAINYAKESN
jgi:hypothetical protein